MKGGTRPLRACGTRFVSHKVAALARLIDRYGAYLNHITMLSQDRKVKSADREKLKGYVLQWRKSKVLLACMCIVSQCFKAYQNTQQNITRGGAVHCKGY